MVGVASGGGSGQWWWEWPALIVVDVAKLSRLHLAMDT